MGYTVLLCVLLASSLTITAEPAVNSPEENRSQYPDVAANFLRDTPVREGTLLQLADYVKHGDTLLKERLQTSYSDLKEQLKQGDTLIKERMVEGEIQLKEQLKGGDSRLKEVVDENVAWMKDRLNKEQERVKETLSEEENKFTAEMSEQKEAFAKLQDSVKTWTKSSSALMDDLKQRMSDLQAELSSTKQQMQTTQTQLATNQQILQSTQQKAKTVEEELQKAHAELTAQLETAQAEIRSLKEEVDKLQSSQRSGDPKSSVIRDEFQSDVGSTFTRWGRTACPGNTSLVYSGIAGGSWYEHPGGAANYLCLVMNPLLDNTTAVPGAVSYLYGAEYEHILGHQDQDVMCSVCRAPQATTLMIPATLSCPAGWITQYRGQLMSAYHGHQGRTEYICVDEMRENNIGGHGDSNGALLYHVVTQCGSLPCPPYINNLITTCVVCSQ